MPLAGREQPEIIQIDSTLRLRAYDGDFTEAVAWYRDEVVYRNSEGITDAAKIPDEEYVRKMYDYLSRSGECYFVEVLEDDKFVPIGDVTLKEENPPIVIGVPRYRGIGIGKKVMQAIIARARELGIRRFYNTAIYDYNTASRRLYESLGFRCVSRRGNVMIYELDLDRDAGSNTNTDADAGSACRSDEQFSPGCPSGDDARRDCRSSEQSLPRCPSGDDAE